MKKVVLLTIAMLTLAAVAQAEAPKGGLGFRSLSLGATGQLVNSNVTFTATPAIGIRHWVSEDVGFDLALGFTSVSAKGGTPTVEGDEGSGIAFDLGVPIALKKWDRVTFMVRPGFTYGTATAKDKLSPLPPNEFETKVASFAGEFEVEWMVAERLGISAAHGIAYRSIKFEDNDAPPSKTEVTGFETTGANFTSLGFHVYLW